MAAPLSPAEAARLNTWLVEIAASILPHGTRSWVEGDEHRFIAEPADGRVERQRKLFGRRVVKGAGQCEIPLRAHSEREADHGRADQAQHQDRAGHAVSDQASVAHEPSRLGKGPLEGPA